MSGMFTNAKTSKRSRTAQKGAVRGFAAEANKAARPGFSISASNKPVKLGEMPQLANLKKQTGAQKRAHIVAIQERMKKIEKKLGNNSPQLLIHMEGEETKDTSAQFSPTAKATKRLEARQATLSGKAETIQKSLPKSSDSPVSKTIKNVSTKPATPVVAAPVTTSKTPSFDKLNSDSKRMYRKASLKAKR